MLYFKLTLLLTKISVLLSNTLIFVSDSNNTLTKMCIWEQYQMVYRCLTFENNSVLKLKINWYNRIVMREYRSLCHKIASKYMVFLMQSDNHRL